MEFAGHPGVRPLSRVHPAAPVDGSRAVPGRRRELRWARTRHCRT